MKSKDELRKIISNKCLSIDLLYHENAARLLVQMGKSLINKADKIAIYHANINEIKLDFLIDFAIKQGKKLFQPISYYDSKIMRFNNYDKNNSKIFYPNNYELKDEIQWYNLDLIFLPLIAVDKLGHRIGKGGGYYDSTLSGILERKVRPILCGVGFDCQLVDKILYDDWDIPIDYFLSEKQLIKSEISEACYSVQ